MRSAALATEVFMNLGIPYAEAPVGSLRFAPPVAKALGDSAFDASNYGSPCPQDRVRVHVHVCKLRSSPNRAVAA